MFMSYEKLMVKKTMKCQINANMARSLKLHFRSYLNKGEGENCQTKRANGRRVSIVYCLYKIQWLDNCIVYEIHMLWKYGQEKNIFMKVSISKEGRKEMTLEEIAHSVYWTAPRIWFPASPGLSSLLSILSFVISGFFQIFFSPVSPLFNLRLPFSKKMTLSPSLTKGHQARSPFFFLLLLSISTFNVQFPNGIPRIPMFFSTSPLFPKQSSLTPPHPSLSSLY